MGQLLSVSELIDLSGKHGIVTGGLKGIGQAITQRLVECGAKVLIADSDPVSYTHLTLPTIYSV